jgi:hypothetical protein
MEALDTDLRKERDKRRPTDLEISPIIITIGDLKAESKAREEVRERERERERR